MSAFDIDHPTEPGRYEAAMFPLADDYDAYTVKADGSLWVELGPGKPHALTSDFVRHRVELTVGPFRRIAADSKPLPSAHHVIGLVGKKRTGKNTAAKHLQRFGYEEVAFADPLRDMALAIDPIVGWARNPERADGDGPVYYSDALAALGYEKAKETYPEFRRFLQRLGTEGVRDTLGAKYGLRDLIGDDLWIVLAEQRIQSSETPLVFTDTRFPNEAALIEKYGATVGVLRPDLPPATDEHPSETALDDYTPTDSVVNDSTPVGLSRAMDDLIDRLKP